MTPRLTPVRRSTCLTVAPAPLRATSEPAEAREAVDAQGLSRRFAHLLVGRAPPPRSPVAGTLLHEATAVALDAVESLQGAWAADHLEDEGGVHGPAGPAASGVFPVAAPSVGVERGDAGLLRVEVDVAERCEELVVRVDRLAPEPALEQRPRPPVLLIEVLRVGDLEPPHRLGEARHLHPHEQVEVVAHEAIGEEGAGRGQLDPLQQAEEVGVVLVVLQYLQASHAAREDVVDVRFRPLPRCPAHRFPRLPEGAGGPSLATASWLRQITRPRPIF